MVDDEIRLKMIQERGIDAKALIASRPLGCCATLSTMGWVGSNDGGLGMNEGR